MNAKRASQSINESSHTSVGIEFSQTPSESHQTQNGVFWLNIDCAARVNIELEVVLNAYISVLSTASLPSQGGMLSRCWIPWRHILNVTIDADLLRASIIVGNCDDHSTALRSESIPHLAWHCARKLHRVVHASFYLSIESSHALLRVGIAVHTMVSVAVECVGVPITGVQIHWLYAPIPSISVKRLELEHSNVCV